MRTRTVPRSESEQVSAWVDLVSPSHPFFFDALVDHLTDVSVEITVREKTETVPLTRELGLDYTVIGQDFDNSLARKLGIPLRTGQLSMQAPAADIALSSRNVMCILAAKARGIPSIHYTDNDITAYVDGLRAEELYNRLEGMATHNVVPAAFKQRELDRWNTSGEVHTYDGVKEDVYVASFEPDSEFTARLPFEEYIVIRPEALSAAYVDVETSIVPALLQLAVTHDLSVVYLPRGRGDSAFANPYDDADVFVPEEPLNGLDLAWHANCVLTGSGTMAREAASMETPAVSFFPNELLSVDRYLVDQGRIFHSRDPEAIIDYVTGLTADEAAATTGRAETVRAEVVELTNQLITQEVRSQ